MRGGDNLDLTGTVEAALGSKCTNEKRIVLAEEFANTSAELARMIARELFNEIDPRFLERPGETKRTVDPQEQTPAVEGSDQSWAPPKTQAATLEPSGHGFCNRIWAVPLGGT